MTDWVTLLDEGDFPGARAAWERQFAGRAGDLEASWALAEVEERWGDSLFFDGEAGAAAHFRAAQAALVPPGVQFTSREENDRRMEAYQRLTNKLYAIDPYGRPRPAHDGQRHPNAPGLRPPEPPRVEPREEIPMEQSAYALLFPENDHWNCYYHATRWRAAGRALAPLHPAGARRACEWSLYFFGLYNEAWAAHLPASRWDSDGETEMTEVRDLIKSLAETSAPSPLPDWVNALLAGEWQRALEEVGAGTPPPEWESLALILADACDKAGHVDDGRRLRGITEPGQP